VRRPGKLYRQPDPRLGIPVAHRVQYLYGVSADPFGHQRATRDNQRRLAQPGGVAGVREPGKEDCVQPFQAFSLTPQRAVLTGRGPPETEPAVLSEIEQPLRGRQLRLSATGLPLDDPHQMRSNADSLMFTVETHQQSRVPRPAEDLTSLVQPRTQRPILGVYLDLLHTAPVGDVDAIGVAPPVVKRSRPPDAHGVVPAGSAAFMIDLPT
jgi:hypothetical protein